MQAISRAAIVSDPRRRVIVALTEALRLLNADMGTAAESFIDPATGETHFQEMILCGEIEDSRKQRVIDYLAGSHADDPMYAAFGVAASTESPDAPIVIRRRQELISDASWYASVHYTTVRTSIGVDAAIYAGLRTRLRGVWVGSGFHRRIGRPQFTDQDVRLLRCFLLGARPLFEAFADTPKGAGPFLSTLTRRQRDLLYALLEGLSAKEISSRLGITVQSAQTYCKRLYQTLGVSGRGELVRLCLQKGVMLDETSVDRQGTPATRPS